MKNDFVTQLHLEQILDVMFEKVSGPDVLK